MAIITMAPYIPLHEVTERAAYAILLFYSRWPTRGENYLVPKGLTALQHYYNILPTLPEYVGRSLKQAATTHEFNVNTGEPVSEECDGVVDELDLMIAQEACDDEEGVQLE